MPYIILNGCDGSGKDTQFLLLLEFFRRLGIFPIIMREPGGEEKAEMIREVILTSTDEEVWKKINNIRGLIPLAERYMNLAREQFLSSGTLCGRTEVYLFAASRAQTNHHIVKPNIENKMILGRRSVACSMAYQGFARNLGMDFVWETNKEAMEGTLPDLEIFIDVSEEEQIRRLRGRSEKQDRLDQESFEFHQRSRQGYLTYFKEYCPYPYVIIDGNGTQEEIFGNLLKVLNPFIK